MHLYKAHNDIRHNHHLSPLKVNSRLQRAAQKHANWMAKNNQMTHTENIPGRVTVADRADQAKYSYAMIAENVAFGQTSVSTVMTGWMNSDGHRRNILNGSYTEIGAALAKSSTGQNYWCVVFGRRR